MKRASKKPTKINKELETIGVSTLEGQELIECLTGKKSPVQADRCNKELKWAVVECDRQFREDGDTQKHKQCLADARRNYDTCMDPGAK